MFQSYRVDLPCDAIKPSFKALLNDSRIDFDALESLLIGGEPIDVGEVTEIIFPTGTPDVFLSHSYADVEVAKRFAGELRSKLGLKVFIDSEVWGSVYKLLKKIDNKFCKEPGDTTYSYVHRNITTSNTFMMLNSALVRMIDKSEVFIFLGSDNSLKFDGTHELIGKNEQTFSPWIHSELLFSSMARINIPQRFLSQLITEDRKLALESIIKASKFPQFIHPANTEHLRNLSEKELTDWLNCGEKGNSSLNKLYELTNVKTNFTSYS